MTLRKLCNHPDLVTNEYSELVTREMSAAAAATLSRGDDEDEDVFDIIPAANRRRTLKSNKDNLLGKVC